MVLAAGVATALHLGKLPPAVPVLQAELGMTLVQAGFMLALIQLAGMFLGLAFGIGADGIGLKRSMVIGLSILSVAGVASGFSHHVGGLLVLRGSGFVAADLRGITHPLAALVAAAFRVLVAAARSVSNHSLTPSTSATWDRTASAA